MAPGSVHAGLCPTSGGSILHLHQGKWSRQRPVGFSLQVHSLLNTTLSLCHLKSPLLPPPTLAHTQLLSLFFSREQVQYAHAGAVAEEVLGSIRTVVAFGGEQKEYNRYKGKLANARRLGITKGAITGVMNGLIYVIIFAVYAAALT